MESVAQQVIAGLVLTGFTASYAYFKHLRRKSRQAVASLDQAHAIIRLVCDYAGIDEKYINDNLHRFKRKRCR